MEFTPETALIVVDMQNDFGTPGGALHVPGGENVLEFVNAQIAQAVEQGAHLVYTQDWHPESTPHFEKDGGIWPVHCVADTTGADFVPGLEVVKDSTRIRKGVGGEDGYSAFNIRDPETGEASATGLAGQLRDRNVARVVIVGLALDYCVMETALDAVSEGFETILLADGTSAVNLSSGDGARAVVGLVAAGVEVQ